MKLAYIVSRFPTASETFVVRELNAISEREDVEVELMSLFSPKEPFVHPSARRWMGRLRRPSVGESLRAVAWWTLRRPLRVLSSVLTVLGGCIRSPGVLLRSLAAVPLAMAHARTVQRLAIEHMHAHFAAYPTLAAWLCHRLTGVPYSFTAHAYDIFVDQSLLAEKVRRASFVVAISEYNRRFLEAYGGDRDTPVHVIHCGVDPAAYRFRARDVPTAGPVRALCVASLQEKKGHSVLLEALAKGGADVARLELDLVGGGELRERLERRVHELGLGGRVRFHGPLPEPEVRALLDSCDLFVLPSIVARDGQMEGIPVVLIEAVACGVPVVASRLSGIPELVRDGEGGLLVEPADPEALCDALRRMLDGEVRLDLEPGRQLVESEFDVRRSADRLLGLFAAADAGPPR